MAVLATFARLCVADLDDAIDALAASGVTGVRLRFGHATGLRLALVGDVLIIAGPEDVIGPFRSTDLTVIVDDLDVAMAAAVQGGGLVRREPAEQATGRNVTMAFPAGPVVEYVEWNQSTRDAAGVP